MISKRQEIGLIPTIAVLSILFFFHSNCNGQDQQRSNSKLKSPEKSLAEIGFQLKRLEIDLYSKSIGNPPVHYIHYSKKAKFSFPLKVRVYGQWLKETENSPSKKRKVHSSNGKVRTAKIHVVAQLHELGDVRKFFRWLREKDKPLDRSLKKEYWKQKSKNQIAQQTQLEIEITLPKKIPPTGCEFTFQHFLMPELGKRRKERTLFVLKTKNVKKVHCVQGQWMATGFEPGYVARARVSNLVAQKLYQYGFVSEFSALQLIRLIEIIRKYDKNAFEMEYPLRKTKPSQTLKNKK